MATYDYQCDKCNKVIEVIHPMTETPDIICEECNEKMRRVISGGQGYILTSGATRSQTWSSRHGHKKTSGLPTPAESAQAKAKEIMENDKKKQEHHDDPYHEFR